MPGVKKLCELIGVETRLCKHVQACNLEVQSVIHVSFPSAVDILEEEM